MKVYTEEQIRVYIESIRGPQGEKGEKGDQGERGEAPTITGYGQSTTGPNGKTEAYLNFSDGKQWKITIANGRDGEKGEKGDKGDPGTAVPLLSGTTDEITPAQVYDALADGKNVIITHDSGTEYGVVAYTNFSVMPDANCIIASETAEFEGLLGTATLIGELTRNAWMFGIKVLVDAEIYAHEMERLDQRTTDQGFKITQLGTDVASIKNGSYLDDLPADKLEMLRGPAGADGAQGEKGEKGDKGDTGAQGPAGADGAQGPKGDKGDKGDTGAQGEAGAAGYSPVRGTDYWTAADIAQIKGYVDSAILNGSW